MYIYMAHDIIAQHHHYHRIWSHSATHCAFYIIMATIGASILCIFKISLFECKSLIFFPFILLLSSSALCISEIKRISGKGDTLHIAIWPDSKPINAYKTRDHGFEQGVRCEITRSCVADSQGSVCFSSFPIGLNRTLIPAM